MGGRRKKYSRHIAAGDRVFFLAWRLVLQLSLVTAQQKEEKERWLDSMICMAAKEREENEAAIIMLSSGKLLDNVFFSLLEAPIKYKKRHGALPLKRRKQVSSDERADSYFMARMRTDILSPVWLLPSCHNRLTPRNTQVTRRNTAWHGETDGGKESTTRPNQ